MGLNRSLHTVLSEKFIAVLYGHLSKKNSNDIEITKQIKLTRSSIHVNLSLTFNHGRFFQIKNFQCLQSICSSTGSCRYVELQWHISKKGLKPLMVIKVFLCETSSVYVLQQIDCIVFTPYQQYFIHITAVVLQQKHISNRNTIDIQYQQTTR